MNVILRRAGLVLNPFFWFVRVYSYCYRFKFKSCGNGFRANYPLVVKGGMSIRIGNNFSLMGTDYLYANDGGEIVIGDNCSVNTNVQIGATAGKIIIGSDVLIGPNVVIRNGNHGVRRDSLMRLQPHSYGEIIIEDDVWIASNAVITSGVILAKGTVVAAGAVVTKSTEPYSIVGGLPARKIGERI
jgi:galactoside O-acetyltransferase